MYHPKASKRHTGTVLIPWQKFPLVKPFFSVPGTAPQLTVCLHPLATAEMQSTRYSSGGALRLVDFVICLPDVTTLYCKLETSFCTPALDILWPMILLTSEHAKRSVDYGRHAIWQILSCTVYGVRDVARLLCFGFVTH
eukprot:SAG31_NODE_424_length_15826_cov_4.954664_21_plen_139_part_00